LQAAVEPGKHYSRNPTSLFLVGRDRVDVDLDPENVDSVAAEADEESGLESTPATVGRQVLAVE
jgi:hypothetical protein